VPDNNAFQEGYDAYWEKERSADNPHPPTNITDEFRLLQIKLIAQ
jgi:hypothetical protein